MPGDWPPEHRWSYEQVDINCPGCLAGYRVDADGVARAAQIELGPPKEGAEVKMTVGDEPIVLKPRPKGEA